RVSYQLLRFPLISSFPQLSPPSLLLASILAASLNTFWSNQLLVFCATIVVRSYSNGYGLVTIVAVVSC
ncbi:unnamed protein product, partial [Hymenolepis diminuta]